MLRGTFPGGVKDAFRRVSKMSVERSHLMCLDGILKVLESILTDRLGGGRICKLEDVLRQLQVRVFRILRVRHDCGCRIG